MNGKIKVLQHVGSMNRAGAETLLMNIYRNIDRQKYEFHFISHISDECDFDREIEELGGKVLYIPSVSEIGLKNFKNEFMKVVNENGPYDAIHTHVQYFSGITLKLANKLKIKKRIAHSHLNEDYKDTNLKRVIYRTYMKYLIRENSTDRFACSIPAGEMLFGTNSFELFRNAIDLDEFKYNKKTDYLKSIIPNLNQSKVVCHIGRFVEAKNHEFILEVFKNILLKNKYYKLILIGDGPRKEFFEEYVKENGLENNVIFLGIRPDIKEILSSVDVILFPSHIEGLPVVLVEAQAAGVPCVISTNIPKEVDMGLDLIEFIDLDKDINVWVESVIVKSQTNKQDFKLREKKIIENGYDLHANIKKLCNIYK